MLIFLTDIVLTVVAWRRGWRGWALVPLAILFLVSFLAGVVCGASGLPENQLRQSAAAPIAILELATLGVLIGLASKRRGACSSKTPQELRAAPEALQAGGSSV